MARKCDKCGLDILEGRGAFVEHGSMHCGECHFRDLAEARGNEVAKVNKLLDAIPAAKVPGPASSRLDAVIKGFEGTLTVLLEAMYDLERAAEVPDSDPSDFRDCARAVLAEIAASGRLEGFERVYVVLDGTPREGKSRLVALELESGETFCGGRIQPLNERFYRLGPLYVRGAS